MKSWGFVYKEMEYVSQGQNFQRRRKNRHKGHRIIGREFEWQAYWFICLIGGQLVLDEVRGEWGIKNVDMVKTYICIPGACFP
jgi:hypothetical protein